MEYRSPIRLVTYTEEPLSPFSLQTLSRARKRLLAEMALQDGEIKLDNVPYTRNDVLSLFDSIKDESIWQYHCIIYTHQPLLDFLEQDVFDARAFKSVEPFLNDEGFVSFVSPYFSRSFQEASNSFIRQNDFDSLSCLLNYQGFILPEQRYDAYHRIRVYLDDLMHLLKNISWEKLSKDESLLYFLFDGNWISFINKLPDEFTSVRDELTGRLLSVIERLQRKATWYYLHECCLRLQYIECSAAHKANVNQFERIIGNNAYKEGNPKTSTGTGSGPSTGRVIFGLIWVVIALFRFANSCNESDSYKYRSYPSILAAGQSVNIQAYNRMEAAFNGQKNRHEFTHFLSTLDLGRDTVKVVKNRTGDQPYERFMTSFPKEGNTEVTINNKTGYDCLLLYFDESDKNLEWEAGKPVAYSAYIKNGRPFKTFVDQSESGSFYIYFGRKWVNLGGPVFFPVRNYFPRGVARVDGIAGEVTSQISLRAGFVPLKGFSQTWLTHSLHLSKNTTDLSDSNQSYLYRPVMAPDAMNEKYKMNLKMTTQDGRVKITAGGDLYLMQSPKE